MLGRLLDAGSAIAGPDGMWVSEPVYDSAATVHASLDHGRIAEQLMTMDADGHYSRPDVFELRVDTRARRNVAFDEGSED